MAGAGIGAAGILQTDAACHLCLIGTAAEVVLKAGANSVQNGTVIRKSARPAIAGAGNRSNIRPARSDYRLRHPHI